MRHSIVVMFSFVFLRSGEVLDLPLLRHLQAIKKIEDDPTLEFIVGEFDKITTMYDNKILVNQSLVDRVDLPLCLADMSIWFRQRVGDPSRVIFETNSLTRALYIAFCWSNARFGWSILLAEGLYIDPVIFKWNLPSIPGNFNPSLGELEIIGDCSVRILLTDSMAIQ